MASSAVHTQALSSTLTFDRMPLVDVVQPCGRDIQIEPLAIGADFKFLVVFLAKAIGLEKYFGDVAVPQFISAAVGIGSQQTH